MSNDTATQPDGAPAGGQFAGTAHAEAAVTLTPPPVVPADCPAAHLPGMTTNAAPVPTRTDADLGAWEAEPGRVLARAAGVEPMPTASAHVSTLHLEGARDDFRNASEATRQTDIDGYLARAQEHMLYAERAMHAAMGQWREYNARLDRLIGFLNQHPEAGEL